MSSIHAHDHAVDRRTVLKGTALGIGVGVAGFLVGGAAVESSSAAAAPKLKGFSAFAESVKVMRKGKYFLVESQGLPSHDMMVGIVSWQQQVPLPQPYTGDNAWQIPVTPVLSDTPLSAKTNFFRGAIALAANGVPIFNALNNRGDDAYLAGELDDWGGHCGMGDDYHYHIAPLHLQDQVGKGKPIAYALDGFPLYGETEPNGDRVTGLDEFNGHFDAKGRYHYHGTKTYPYINGGLRGVVHVAEGQVDPQPRAAPARPGQPPLRGAEITEFSREGSTTFDMAYTLNGGTYRLHWVADLTTVTMTFRDPSGDEHTEVYRRASI